MFNILRTICTINDYHSPYNSCSSNTKTNNNHCASYKYNDKYSSNKYYNPNTYQYY